MIGHILNYPERYRDSGDHPSCVVKNVYVSHASTGVWMDTSGCLATD